MNDFTGKLANDFGEGLEVGDRHYRAWVGPPNYYDLVGALQFNVITNLGLREYHTLLDIGCGSLRGGRLAIMYLRPGNYFGIEPENWALEQGKKAHLGEELLTLKQPSFSNDSNFTLTVFNTKFDFLLAHSIFTHAASHQITRCLEEARKVMTSESIFVATFDESADYNYEGYDWVYPGISEYTKEYMSSLVENAGLKCTYMDWIHPWGQTWFVVTDPSNNLNMLNLGEMHFSPINYLSAHPWDQRNEKIRKMCNEQ